MAAPDVFEGSAVAPRDGRRPVVTIGNFDGVHLGHRALVSRARDLAAPLAAPTCVLTFDPPPRAVLRPASAVPAIQSLADKVALLGMVGADQVVVEPFDVAFAARGARWFAEEVLGRRLRASAVVVGWDFRFGQGRGGTVDGLREWLDVPVTQVDAVVMAGAPISSSRVRAVVAEGDVALAARLLGRAHEVVGVVVHGDERGRTLGFPTANVQASTGLLPPAGVYAAWVLRGATSLRAVVNVGTRPTFSGTEARFEVHVLDAELALYGEQLRVALVARLRDERAFSGSEALKAQIAQDIVAARAVLG